MILEAAKYSCTEYHVAPKKNKMDVFVFKERHFCYITYEKLQQFLLFHFIKWKYI